MENTKKTKKQILKEILKENITEANNKVWAVIRHVSKSGTTRDISLFVVRDNFIFNISDDVAKFLDLKLRNGGIRVKGVGMDMVYWLVNLLGQELNLTIKYFMI